MTTQELIREIHSRLLTAASVELPTREPRRLHWRLYRAAKRRALRWRFAETERGVVVALRKE